MKEDITLGFLSYRTLQAEYDRLREANEMRVVNGNGFSDSMEEPEDHDEEMIAEAKLLRQHKGRLESRMRILEDHNKQLEAQLQRLRHLLDQVRTNEDLAFSSGYCFSEITMSQYMLKHWKIITSSEIYSHFILCLKIKPFLLDVYNW